MNAVPLRAAAAIWQLQLLTPWQKVSVISVQCLLLENISYIFLIDKGVMQQGECSSPHPLSDEGGRAAAVQNVYGRQTQAQEAGREGRKCKGWDVGKHVVARRVTGIRQSRISPSAVLQLTGDGNHDGMRGAHDKSNEHKRGSAQPLQPAPVFPN
jgi:hypothetical protein